jgi:hypothetical protein
MSKDATGFIEDLYQKVWHNLHCLPLELPPPLAHTKNPSETTGREASQQD